MANVDVWPAVHEERAALAEDLAGITDEQWATPSLCSEWTVHDVLAHMTATAKITPGAFVTKLVTNGFSFGKLQAKDIASEGAGAPSDVLRRFREVVSRSSSPPGPKVTWLGEVIIHGEDIRRPLGITASHDPEHVAAVADFYKGSNLIIGAKKRVDGVTLTATDAEWSNGSGPEVRGPLLALLMAMVGRKPFLDDCEGDGVAALRSRA
jgi:uncharacterized protein (TIGR03083 family)